MKVCSTPGCPALTTKSKCDKCRSEQRKASDAKRPNSGERGYDAKWQRTSKQYLAKHPICEDESGCTNPATDVHHLDGQGPNGPRGHDEENLQSLCHTHHSTKTSAQQPGGWNLR